MTTASKTIKTTKPTSERTHRESVVRISDYTVKDILKIKMNERNLKNVDLQQALGYKMPNVIAMMKSGAMRLPANKAIVAARALNLDPVFLLSKLIEESDADLWDTIKAVLGRKLITENEMNLLDYVRDLLNGQDIALIDSSQFRSAIEAVVGPLTKTGIKEIKMTIELIDKEHGRKTT